MQKFFVIGVGASAGGIEALTSFFSHIASPLPAAFIVVQHLSLKHKSRLTQLIDRVTNPNLSVVEVTHQMPITAGKIYVTPAGYHVQVKKQHFLLSNVNEENTGPKPSIDTLFTSIAVEYQNNAMGVILSGTGTDGSKGIKEVKKQGGLTFAQYLPEAKFTHMPETAIQTGCVNYILEVAAIAQKINQLLLPSSDLSKRLRDTPANGLAEVFTLLKNHAQVDFTNYKKNTIHRRLKKRLQANQLSGMIDYVKLLQENTVELEALYKSLLIGVSSFFRDKQAFELLKECLAQLLAKKSRKEALRVWIIGCASGQEVYSIAIMLTELLEKVDKAPLLQLFATDIDEEALDYARKGIYTTNELKGVSKVLLKRYFTKQKDGHWEVKKAIRAKVLFARHNIMEQPPFLRMDLISCRNVLIYFNQALQSYVHHVMYQALHPNGILFIGKSESLGDLAAYYEPYKEKIYLKKPQLKPKTLVPIKPLIAKKEEGEEMYDVVEETMDEQIQAKLRKLFDYPYILIDESHHVLEIHGKLDHLLFLKEGKTQFKLLELLHSDLQLEVQRLCALAKKEKTLQSSPVKRLALSETLLTLKILVQPLTEAQSKNLLVIFQSISQSPLSDESSSSDSKTEETPLQELKQELAVTKDHLQRYIEELETSNEELQKLNEASQSSNEALQSTNEELETSNEELQASYEELQVAYDEIRAYSKQLEEKDRKITQINNRFASLLNSTLQGFLLVESNFTVSLFNTTAANIIHQFSNEVLAEEKSLLDFFPEEVASKILKAVKLAFTGKGTAHPYQIVQAQTTYFLEVNFTPIIGASGAVELVALSFLDKTIEKKQKETLTKNEAYLNSLVESSSYYLVRTDLEGKYTYVNRSFCEQFGFDQKIVGQDAMPTIHPDDHETCRQAVEACLAEVGKVEKLMLRKPLPNGGFLHTAWEFVAVENGQGALTEIQCVGRDMTEEKEILRQLEAEKQVRQLIRENSRLGTWYWYFEGDDRFVGDAHWSSMLGYRASERLLTGKKWKSWLHPEDKTAFLLALSQYLSEETTHFAQECRIRCKNGHWKWVLIAAKVLQKEAYVARKVMGIMIDISSTKEQFQPLGENLAYTTDAVIVTDLNQTVSYANQAAGDLFGHEVETLVGADFSKLYPHETTQEEDLLKVAGDQNITKEWKIKNRWGKATWIQMHLNLIRSTDQQPVGFVAIARDVTATRENYETIQDAKEQYERLINSIDVIVWEYDWEKQVYLFISEHVQDFLGYPVESWYNIPNFWETILYEEDKAAIQERMHKQVAQLQNYTTEYRAETIEGEMVWIEEVVTVVEEEGKPVLLQGIMIDITQRKSLEAKIAQSEKKYKLLAENASDLVFIMNDDHRFQYVSPVVEKMYGYSVEEFLKFKWENLLAASSLLNARRHLEELEETSPQDDSIKMQLEQVKKEGSTFWTEVTMKIIYNDNGQFSGFLGTTRDISEEVAQEREIEKLATVAKSTTNGIIITDTEGAIEWSNEAFERITGYEAAILHGKKIYEILQGPNTNMVAVDSITLSILNKQFFDKEMIRYHQSGTEYWAHIDGKPIYDDNGKHIRYIVVETDITTTKQKELHIREISKRLSLATQAADLGIWEWDLNSEYLNWTKLYNGEEVIIFKGHTSFFLNNLSKISKAQFRIILEEARQGLARKEIVFSIFLEEELRIIKGYFLLVHSDDGQPIKLIGMTTDITEQREEEKDKQTLINDLKSKNKSLEEFTYVISHNLRGPLANIIGLAQIYDPKKSGDDNQKVIEGLLQSATRLDNVVRDLNDILSLRKQNDVKRTEFTISETIAEVEANLSIQIERSKVTIHKEILVDRLFSIKSLFYSIMQNLISNAIKYRTTETSPKIWIYAKVVESTLQVVVKDNGLGIDLDRYGNKLFKMYKRFHTHTHIEGKGIGLYLVKVQVEDLDGWIEVESKPDEGTTFTLHFPQSIMAN